MKHLQGSTSLAEEGKTPQSPTAWGRFAPPLCKKTNPSLRTTASPPLHLHRSLLLLLSSAFFSTDDPPPLPFVPTGKPLSLSLRSWVHYASLGSTSLRRARHDVEKHKRKPTDGVTGRYRPPCSAVALNNDEKSTREEHTRARARTSRGPRTGLAHDRETTVAAATTTTTTMTTMTTAAAAAAAAALRCRESSALHRRPERSLGRPFRITLFSRPLLQSFPLGVRSRSPRLYLLFASSRRSSRFWTRRPPPYVVPLWLTTIPLSTGAIDYQRHRPRRHQRRPAAAPRTTARNRALGRACRTARLIKIVSANVILTYSLFTYACSHVIISRRENVTNVVCNAKAIFLPRYIMKWSVYFFILCTYSQVLIKLFI